jgi:RNA polymerase sigma-70 factor (ECF subfamily)
MTINDLYQAASHGDKDAEHQMFSALTVRFGIIANLKVRNREDAEELVQDAMMVISEKIKQLEVVSSFKAWAHQVFENRLMNYISRKQRRSKVDSKTPVDEVSYKASTTPDPDLMIQLKDCMVKVRSANNRYARILVLHYQGFSTKEICERLGITPQNLYMIMSRARTMLKLCLEKGDVR